MRHLLKSMLLALAVVVLAIVASPGSDKKAIAVEIEVAKNAEKPQEDIEKPDKNTYESGLASSGFHKKL
ncbi:MAG: hypothetical protein WA913_08795 [Pricia sp.]